MTTYVADFDGNNITFTQNGVADPNFPIPLNQFTLNDGITAASRVPFTKNQEIFNYLDGLKDGCNVYQMQGLNIYPRARKLDGTFPTKDKIKTIRQNVVNAHRRSLNRTTWLKLKKGSPLNPPKQYNYCSYDSGTNPTVFMERVGGGAMARVIENFGTYMDPASKIQSSGQWPPVGDTIELSSNFLKLMGFGNSSVEATTIGQAPPLQKYLYKITIEIPNAVNCSGNANQCIITNMDAAGNYAGDAEARKNFNFFAGNAVKNNVINIPDNAGTRSKIKFIIAKEMGDKLQVLFHFLRYNQAKDITLCTCDMPVFVLCMTLKIPCIFTGAGLPPAGLPAGRKYYSVREYKPGDPLVQAKARMRQIRNNIHLHNDQYIGKLTRLGQGDGVGTLVSIGAQKYPLPGAFYIAAVTDLSDINQMLLIDNSDNIIDALATVDAVNDAIETMKKKFTFIPFIANTKKASKLKNGGQGVNDVAILARKTYTKENPFPHGSKKPEFERINLSYKNKSFRDIAFILRNMIGGGKKKRKQKGGADLGSIPSAVDPAVMELYRIFPGDDDEPVRYQYTKPDEMSDDSPAYSIPGNQGLWGVPFKHVRENNKYNHFYMNFMERLNQSFMASIYNIREEREIDDDDLIEFIELLYTELIYTSYINNTSPINIDEGYINTFMVSNIMDVPPLKEEKGIGKKRIEPKKRFAEIAKGGTERRFEAAKAQTRKNRQRMIAMMRHGPPGIVGGKKTRKKKKRKRKKTRRRKKHKRKTRRKR